VRRLAITGIGGFIGRRMAERALAEGWRVTGLDISPAAAERLAPLGVEVVTGDINDRDALAKAFAGADVVFHTAAVVAEDGPRERYERVNNQGTHSVCEVARDAGVRRLVHLSSIMVYGFDYPDGVTEAGPFADAGNIYNETKLSSERIALAHDDPEHGLGVIVIRPGDVYGAGSQQWVRRPLASIRRGLFMLPDGGRGVMNHVHVDNLIDGVWLALAADACGEAFNITDDAATPCRVFYDYHRRMAGKRTVPTLPAPILRLLLRRALPALAPLGIEPPAKPAVVDFLTRRHKISCAKARDQLGYHPRIDLDTGMRRVAAELRAEGEVIHWPALKSRTPSQDEVAYE